MTDASGLDVMLQSMQSSTPIPTTPVLQPLVKDEGPETRSEKAPLVEDKQPEVIEVIEEEPEPSSSTSPALLGDLETTDHLVIDRRLLVKTILTLRGKKNKYHVRLHDGSLVYTVTEYSPWWSGYILYGIRPMTLAITDTQGQEVLRLRRPFSLTTRLVPCQLQRMQIHSPPDNFIGSIEQMWSAMRPLYLIKNRDGEVVFGVSGPRITVHFCRDVVFKVARIEDGTVVATSCKRWQGLGHAIFMSAITGRFSVNYDMELSAEEKAFVLAGTILMDYLYYDI